MFCDSAEQLSGGDDILPCGGKSLRYGVKV